MFSLIQCCLFVCAMLLATAAQAADNIEFNFQGRLFSGGQPVNDPALIKFALIDANATTTIWSNDDSSVACSQPTSSVPVSVQSGIFDVMVGDPTLMDPIHGALFNGRDDLRLRIWLSDGVHGFEQLSPDRRIPNADLLGLRTLTEPLTVYVNDATGNDAENGLAPGRAKKTIQAAIDMLPHNLKASVTVDIADGIYRETVRITDINASSDYTLTLMGDAHAGNAETTTPAVRITGTNDDSTHAIERNFGIVVVNCSNINLVGIFVDYAPSGAISIERSGGSFDRVSVNQGGINLSNNSNFKIVKTWCTQSGFTVRYGSYGYFLSGGAKNGYIGMLVDYNSSVTFSGTSKFLNHTLSGIQIDSNSVVNFTAVPAHVGSIQNCASGIRVIRSSVCSGPNDRNTFSGNGTNILLEHGGTSYAQIYTPQKKIARG